LFLALKEHLGSQRFKTDNMETAVKMTAEGPDMKGDKKTHPLASSSVSKFTCTEQKNKSYS
jgi:hypothetical protein